MGYPNELAGSAKAAGLSSTSAQVGVAKSRSAFDACDATFETADMLAASVHDLVNALLGPEAGPTCAGEAAEPKSSGRLGCLENRAEETRRRVADASARLSHLFSVLGV